MHTEPEDVILFCNVIQYFICFTNYYLDNAYHETCSFTAQLWIWNHSLYKQPRLKLKIPFKINYIEIMQDAQTQQT